MRPLQLLICALLVLVTLQCKKDETPPDNTPSFEFLEGVWRSEHNDSMKFVNQYEVYMNSVLHKYPFSNQNIQLMLFACQDSFTSYSCKVNEEARQLTLHNFSNAVYDSAYRFHNPGKTVFTKTDEPIHLPFEEWIQGRWENENKHGYSFTRPEKIKNTGSYHCFDFTDEYFYELCKCTRGYLVFTSDTLIVMMGGVSGPCPYSYRYFTADKNNYLFNLTYYLDDEPITYYKIIEP